MIGRSQRLVILAYHRVLAEPDPLREEEIPASTFERQARVLRRWFNVLPLDEALARLRAGDLPRNAVSITFDDGYADNFALVAPILDRFQLHVTFFIAAGFLDGGRMWNDTIIESTRCMPGEFLDLDDVGLGRHRITSMPERASAARTLVGRLKYLPDAERKERVDALAARAGLPDGAELMMTASQVRGLARSGYGVGAHTMNHPILKAVDDDVARREIESGKQRLEEITQRPVPLFAYPNGMPGVDFDDRHSEMVREAGFEAALSAQQGAADRSSDVYRLPRIWPWKESGARFSVRTFLAHFGKA